MENIINQGKEYIMNNGKFGIVITERKGSLLTDASGKEYLNFVAGTGANDEEALFEAISKQAAKLTDSFNLCWNEPQIDLAKKLADNSCFSKVCFCNSGSESVDEALKLARRYAFNKGYDRHEIIAMENSFHGNTFGAVSVSGRLEYQKGIYPILPGVNYAPLNNIEVLKNTVTDKTCAIIIEPVQCEGGIYPAHSDYLRQVRTLCDERDILLIFDEVLSGMGRLGALFAYQHFGVEPDIAALAGGLGAGLPIGAMLANEKAAAGFEQGSLSTMPGGNPIAAAAANIVIDEILEGSILLNVKSMGNYLEKRLIELKQKLSCITDIRGIGLMQCIELTVPAWEIILKCINNGLLVDKAGTNIIKFTPPLNVTKEDIDRCIGILESIIN